MYLQKRKKERQIVCDLEASLSLTLDVSSAVDDVASRRRDVDGVQNRSQYLAERPRGEGKSTCQL